MLTAKAVSGDFHRLPGAVLAATAVLLLCARPALAAGEEGVQHWLDRMARAVESLNYRGTLVHVRGDQVDTLKIIHRSDENGVRERIYSIDGEPREVLRDGDKVRCLLPGDQPQVLESHLAGRLLPNLPVNRLAGPESPYRMTITGRERVAGLMARVVTIKPRDEYRYGYRLWLEEDTGMLLRYALADYGGRQLQQLSFTSIELGVAISDAELKPELTNPGTVLKTRLSDPDGILPVGPRDPFRPEVPVGFHLANSGHGHGESGGEFRHMVFSDGLASFSVYIERATADAVGSRVEAIGPLHVFTSQVGEWLFTVVGEVPAATVEYVGRQFRRMAEPARTQDRHSDAQQ